MNVKQINLDDDGVPESVFVRMSRDEALYLAKLTGRQTHTSAGDILTGCAALNTEVYESLTGDLFNRYYDDGVNDAVRSR